MPALQLSAAQVVPFGYRWQLPAPSQVPSVPHEPAPRSLHSPRGSEAAAGLGAQVPGEVDSAQLWQAAVQAELQQTPSTQNVEAHSLPAEQGCPGDLGPQLPFTQVWPAMQSLSPAQWLTQAPPAHWYVPHSCTPGIRQVPSPSQVPAVFTRFPLQVGGTQTVSAAYFAQPPTPSQAPVCPHVDGSVVAHSLCGSSAPRAVGPQVPIRPL